MCIYEGSIGTVAESASAIGYCKTPRAALSSFRISLYLHVGDFRLQGCSCLRQSVDSGLQLLDAGDQVFLLPLLRLGLKLIRVEFIDTEILVLDLVFDLRKARSLRAKEF